MSSVEERAAEADAADKPVAPEGAPPDAPKKRDAALSGAVKASSIAAVVMAALMAVLMDVTFAVGTLIGGALATVNLILFIRLGEAFLSQRGSSAPWAILGALKLLGLFACVFIILRQGAVSPLAFVIGYGALPIGIALSSLFRPKT